MKFALFFLGEYVNALAVAIIFSTLFLGGYAGPGAAVLGPFWLLLKCAVVFTLFMWLRGTLPRVRVDQMHDMNWKFFVPISIVNLLVVMILGKLFVPTEQIAQATGSGVVVGYAGQAAVMFVASAAIGIIGLSLAGRNARAQRVAEERTLASRVAENMLTGSRAIAK